MLNFNTRIEDQQRVIDQAIDGRLSAVWTAIPAQVTKYNPEAITVECQPLIQGRRTKEDGSVELMTLPLLLDCPVIFPHAGGGSITFPIKVGDEVLVIFSCRGIDFWWQNSGIQPPPEIRMHDLSDGFALPGIWSQPKKIGNLSTDSLMIRSDDKSAYIEIKTESKDINSKTSANMTATVGGNVTVNVSGNANINVAGSTTLDCPTNTITGTLTVRGLITGQGGLAISGGSGASVDGNLTTTGDVTAAGISLDRHTHSGVTSGGSNTGGPQ